MIRATMQNRFLIFGGSSGIGLGVAQAALATGASVVLVGRSHEKLQSAAQLLASADRVATIAADLTVEADVARVFETVGDVDHVVTTAVDAAYQPISQLEIPAARRAIDSKLVGALLLARYGAPHVRPGGSLIFTSGIAARRPSPGGAVIAAVNGALESLARALALELAPMRVNVVSPGWVDTPVWDSIAGDRKKTLQAQMAQRLPVKRIGRVEDIAEAVLFLVRNTFTTGTVLSVDGGHRFV